MPRSVLVGLFRVLILVDEVHQRAVHGLEHRSHPLRRGGQPKRHVGLASLQARKGDTLRFSATGPEAEQAVEALALFVSSGFGE